MEHFFPSRAKKKKSFVNVNQLAQWSHRLVWRREQIEVEHFNVVMETR